MAMSAVARATTRRAPRAFLPGEPWLDSAGRRIEAHGGGILLHEGVYLWYGEDHAHGVGNAAGIRCYSSRDLLRWDDEGLALPATALPEQYRASGACERPKVLFCAATGKFVMWAHLDCGQGYTAAEAGIAIADRPQGPFTLVRRGRPIRHDFGQAEDRYEQRSRGPTYRDMALFLDDDGSGYVFYAAEGNKTLYVSRLARDFTWVEEPAVEGRTWARVLVGMEREAPAPFKHAGRYHLLSSGCTGWAPNPGLHAIAESPLGPWRIVGDPCRGAGAETNYRSQPTFVLPAPGKPAGCFVYLGDRWIGHRLQDSSHVWLPFHLGDDARVQLDWHGRWDWSLFDGAGGSRLRAPAKPRVSGGSLTWKAVPGAQVYRVHRNGQDVGTTSATRFALPPALPGRAYAWTVVACAVGREPSPPSPSVVVATPGARDCWLSDLEPDAWSQGWSVLRRDQSLLQEQLRLSDGDYQHGLATHAVSRIVYRLAGAYGRLTTRVGFDPGAASHPGLVVCRIYGDGRLLADGGPMVATDAPRDLSADLAGVHELVLAVEDGGRGHDYGWACWCDPRLTVGSRRSARRPAGRRRS